MISLLPECGHRPGQLCFRLARASTLMAVIAALVTTGCRFKVDRTLPPGEITGTVISAASPGQKATPVASARVVLENSSVKISADAHGDFAIVGLAAGTYAVDITPPASSPLAGSVGIHVGGLKLAPLPGGTLSGFDLGTITLERYGGIAGTVTLNGQPVTGAVAVLPGYGRAMSTDGVFAFFNVLPGEYSMTVVDAISGGARISQPLKVTVSPGAVLQLPPIDLSTDPVVTTGSITGQAQLSGASSSAGVTIALNGVSTTTQTDSQGNYSQSNVPANVYNLTATANGFQQVTLNGVIVGGPTTTVPEILLTAVTAATSTPDAGTVVTTTSAGNPYAIGSGNSVSSSSNFQLTIVSGTVQQPERSRNFQYLPGPVASGTASQGGNP
jgi:hypothetical protein